MTQQDRVARLESLLERIRTNATLPRPSATASPAAPVIAKAPEPKPVSEPSAASAPITQEPATFDRETAPPQPPPFLEPPPLVVQPAAVEPPPLVTEAPALPTPTPAWAAEPPSAVQPRPTTPPEELSDDDLLEVTTLPPAPVEPAPPAELAASAPDEAAYEEEEQPPASSRRSKVAETLDEALAGAAQLDEEREVPVKTPPPESGPQEALPAGLEAPGVPDVDRLEADLMGPPSMGPTAEQLGETIELDEPVGPQLEIDVAVAAAAPPEPERPPEELEVTLPRGPMPSGTYDVEVPNAPVEIEVSDAEPTLPPIDMPPVSREFVPTVPAASASPGERVELSAERTLRPQHGATDVARVVLAPQSTSKNFVELLDISLSL